MKSLVIKNYEPYIKHIPSYSFLFSILQPDSDYFYDILMNNFHDFYSIYLKKENRLNFRYADTYMWNKFQCIDHIFISKNSLVKFNQIFLDWCLSNGYCILCCIDTFYISAYSYYKKHHMSHEIMIYGFNKVSNKYICKDFFDFKLYETKEVGFDEIEKAIKNYCKTSYHSNDTGCIAIRKTNNFKMDFDVIEFKNQIGMTIIDREITKNKSWGIDTFDAVQAFLVANRDKFDLFCVRIFCNFICENMKIYQGRISFLKKNRYIQDNDANILLKRSLQIEEIMMHYRNILVKEEIRESMKEKRRIDVDHFIIDIMKVKQEYKDFVRELINNL